MLVHSVGWCYVVLPGLVLGTKIPKTLAGVGHTFYDNMISVEQEFRPKSNGIFKEFTTNHSKFRGTNLHQPRRFHSNAVSNIRDIWKVWCCLVWVHSVGWCDVECWLQGGD